MSKVVDIRPIVFHVFHGFRLGGTEIRTCRIINALKDRYRHVIFSISGNFDARKLIHSSADVRYLTQNIKENPFFLNLICILKVLRKEKPDLLIAYAWGAIDWILVNAISRICPMIHAAEGFDDTEIKSQFRRRLLIRRILFARCEKIVTCSRLLEKISYEEWWLYHNKVSYIPNGVKLNVSVADNNQNIIPRYESTHKNKLVCGIVASLIKLKNHKRLLRSFSILLRTVPALLYIAGDGPERVEIQKYCRDLGIKNSVVFLGYTGDPYKVLSRLDIFCLSSDTEQAPMVILEAMASGLPIVSTDVGDVKFMVSAENKRFIVEKNNDEAYHLALLSLAGNKKMRSQIGLANMNKCAMFFNEDLMFKRYDSLYKNTINSKLT